MKLAPFSFGGRTSIGVVRDDRIADVGGEKSLPITLEALLALGPEALAQANRVADRAQLLALKDVKLHAPVESPRKFLAIAANYQSHIDEVKRKNPAYVPPTSQRWFNKQVTCINGPFDPIWFPPEAKDLDYEVELAVIVGKRCRRVSEADAPSVIAGYTICNDVSVRDWQKLSPTIMLGKSFDGHGPLGPWIVTADEIEDPHALDMTCRVNDQVRQSGSTREMIDNVYAQIAHLSTVFTLEPGNVLATGTPFGAGAGMDPPGLLKIGDIVRCEISRIGAIEAKLLAEPV